MDNLIIGLLPVVTPSDEMKIAVSGGVQAITVGGLRKIIQEEIDKAGGGSGQTDKTLKYIYDANGIKVENKTFPITNDELKKGFNVYITDSVTTPISWTQSNEGITQKPSNDGYSLFVKLTEQFLTYPAGAKLHFDAVREDGKTLELVVEVIEIS